MHASNAPRLIGIDGGGTKTQGAIADGEGNILARAESGPSNVFKVDASVAEQSLHHVIEELLQKISASKSSVAAICAGLAGVDRPSVQKQVREMFARVLPVDKISVVGDATTALIGATGGEPGVVVISGTGSIAYGMNEKRQRARAGGWGHIVDDFGSGYDIVRNAFNEVFRAHDGLEPPTKLKEAFLAELQVDTVDNLLIAIHTHYTNAQKVASLFPLVQRIADAGDPLALKILRRAGEDLSMIAEAVIRKLDMYNTEFPLGMAGGVFQSSPQVRESLKWQVRRYAPKASVDFPKHSAVEGAVLLARAHFRDEKII